MKIAVGTRLLLVCAVGALVGCDDEQSSGPSAGRASGGAGGAGRTDGGAGGGGAGGQVADAAVAADAAASLPPDAGMIVANRPERRDFSPALLDQLRLKSGFRIQLYATGIMGARMLAVGPDGSAYLTVPMKSEVNRLRDNNGDGDVNDPGERTVVASAMETPALQGVHGIAFHQGKVYLGAIKSVVSGLVSPAGDFTALSTVVSNLPDGGQHPNRTLAVGPDGKLYISVGSDCNACNETNPEHATMLRVEVDGSMTANPANPQHPMLAHNPMSQISPRVWASGLRNTLGFDWHPVTKELWGFDQGSDGLGEETPPDELNRLVGGKSYGWPFCWGQQQPDPVVDAPSQMLSKQQYCPGSEPAQAGVDAHSSPIAFLFYAGTQFPAEYRNDAFLVLRGSWDRAQPAGYKLVRVNFENGVPTNLPGSTSVVEDFVSGFLIENGKAHFGRIAGLAIDSAGALLLSDDTNGNIYRISYPAGGASGDAGDGGDGTMSDGGAVDAGADAP